MNATTYTALLKTLQKLQKTLVAAYEEKARGDRSLSAHLKARHEAAEVGGTLDSFIGITARRSAVQLILRTVYVRALEDLGALSPPRIRGDRGLAVFREVAPGLQIRSYLKWTFRDLAHDFPALFTPGPDELPLPGEDHCRLLWEIWHDKDGQGKLRYDWKGQDGGFDSRFLGDLYQDLDKDVRKRFALLQTPEFVEEYILDHTLTPALVEFDPAALKAEGQCFRLIDPTCGSGHFLIGAFRRLLVYWKAQGLEDWEASVAAMEGVWGCDINPHAVDIARFRLMLEVMEATGVQAIEKLAALPLNLRAMDSLIPWEWGEKQKGLFPAKDRLSSYATPEERAANGSFLKGGFEVVVGNPPYITPKDVRKRDDYRAFWPDSCYMGYALSAPFLERFYCLGKQKGYTGQITSNSFMKRQFGKKVIETVLPKWEVTNIIDSSGAYIPGHGTPTVILLGRSMPSTRNKVRLVLGKRGEPYRPKSPSNGLVWRAICNAGPAFSDKNPYVTVSLSEPSVFHKHPWTLKGGEAISIKAKIEKDTTPVVTTASRFGMMTTLKCDDVYFSMPPDIRHSKEINTTLLVEGLFVRDYAIVGAKQIVFPYSPKNPIKPAILAKTSNALKHLWPFREILYTRTSTGFKNIRQRGVKFYEYAFYFPESYSNKVITGAFVSTHNHFVLSRGGQLFNRSAPTIMLPDSSSLEDHLNLLGLLNSSTLGFWMKQVFHDKGGGGIGGGLATESWEHFYEYDSTKLKKAPITTTDRAPRIEFARAPDTTAITRATCLPAAILNDTWTATNLATHLTTGHTRYRALTEQMVALQEELDWLTYHSYGLLDTTDAVGPEAIEPLAPGHRPFEIVFAIKDAAAPAAEKAAWWSRHGHDKVTEIPKRYSPTTRARIQARIDTIKADEKIAHLEQPQFKRRWQTPDYDAEIKKAAESWLLDRLEDLFAPRPTPPAEDAEPTQPPHSESGTLSKPRPYRLEEVATAWLRDDRIAAAAKAWAGNQPVDLTLLCEQLLRDAALPDNPQRLYSASGLRKKDTWKKTWALQDLEDANLPLVDPDTGKLLAEIPLPDKYKRGDFAVSSYYSIRGKLDVPRERFILFADLVPQQYGWNGWRDRERAAAQLSAYRLTQNTTTAPLPPPTAADPRRCGPTIGLWESLPDVKRWSDAGLHARLEAFAQNACSQKSCPCALVQKWQEWKDGKLTITTPTTDTGTTQVTIEERAAMLDLFRYANSLKKTPVRKISLTLKQINAARVSSKKIPLQRTMFDAQLRQTQKKLEPLWDVSTAHLEQILADLLTSGELSTTGKGDRIRYVLLSKPQT